MCVHAYLCIRMYLCLMVPKKGETFAPSIYCCLKKLHLQFAKNSPNNPQPVFQPCLIALSMRMHMYVDMQ